MWGDPVHVVAEDGDRTEVRARTATGFVETSHLTDRSLLEVYVIDVGQGDGILMRTPDDCWHMIDAGRRAEDQTTKKGAANFLRWKFLDDLEEESVSLRSAITTHPDSDHFAGFIDVLSGTVPFRDSFPVQVDRFFHSGLGRFGEGPELGAETDGKVAPFPQGFKGIRENGSFYTELLDGADDFADPSHELMDEFGEYAALVATVPDEVRRLSYGDRYLPGYAPGDGDVVIHVLGPVVEEYAPGQSGLRKLGSNSVTLNGHSIVLRVDFGDVRILLTGDLNTQSQKLLRSYHADEELEVDVAKACHHGAEDVDLEFVKAMAARATVISSGDDENYAHPRPVLMGAAGLYGRESKPATGSGTMPPLLYSTELSRAVKLAYPYRIGPIDRSASLDPRDFRIRTDRRADVWWPLATASLATDLVYGLVNVRTDGKTVLCATLEEKGDDFDVKTFRVTG
ncbi:MAG: ComEC/Rec2 family competence protein [Actinomycetota bacterium]